MILAFDSRVFCSEDCNNGIWTYARNLLVQLQNISAEESVTLKVFWPPNSATDPSRPNSNLRTELINAPFLRYPRLWELGGVAIAAARANADLIFSPSYHTCPLGPVPVVATIHDATPVKSPSFGVLRDSIQKVLLWNTARFSLKCITTSQHSKGDLIDIYDLPPEKVVVVYNGYDKARFNTLPTDSDAQRRVLANYGVTRPYILHHGAVQPRKNLVRLIQAFRALLHRRRDLDLDLVLAGPLAWRFKEIVAVASQPAERGRVILTGPVHNDEMPLFVKGAALCVTPSFYEGFCLPVIEAMACGVPCVASHTSCIPEVSGEVLEYFNPFSVDDMTGCMERALDDSTLRQRLIYGGVKRASEFSWERCARETLSVLQNAYLEARSRARKPEPAVV